MRMQDTRKVWRVVVALVLAAELSGCASVSTARTRAVAPTAVDGTSDVAGDRAPERAGAGVEAAPAIQGEDVGADGARAMRFQDVTNLPPSGTTIGIIVGVILVAVFLYLVLSSNSSGHTVHPVPQRQP